MQDSATRSGVWPLPLLIVLASLTLLVAGSAEAKKRHKPSGVKGMVLDASCYGPCIEPPPPQPVYSGPVTVTLRRASDGAVVASREVSEGHFRFRLKRGLYDVSSVPPNPPNPPICPPGYVCIQGGSPSAVMIAPCLAGETKRVQVRRHRFSQVELRVTNVCIV
jgi:hypothetical protein